jgi:hypothetical protein
MVDRMGCQALGTGTDNNLTSTFPSFQGHPSTMTMTATPNSSKILGLLRRSPRSLEDISNVSQNAAR